MTGAAGGCAPESARSQLTLADRLMRTVGRRRPPLLTIKQRGVTASCEGAELRLAGGPGGACGLPPFLLGAGEDYETRPEELMLGSSAA
ncbi:hypothetical protein NDU88_003908 [Pleurodeles waltl]|uniref:Uncharacterized protein n=1 Tax=Pleurodeles waltl TaxID=8319 RepID=A0AAV7NI42_PLEWA|nr:hypothetical protein NDU88_003908 [Pleurodeles waltl]